MHNYHEIKLPKTRGRFLYLYYLIDTLSWDSCFLCCSAQSRPESTDFYFLSDSPWETGASGPRVVVPGPRGCGVVGVSQRATGASEVPVFTAQQFITYTPAPARPRLDFVTCRFIFSSIKTTLQAHQDSWSCTGEGSKWGNPRGEARNERIK